MSDIYQEHGYANREEYLLDLADQFGVKPNAVFILAEMLGPEEDFDGLVTYLEDYIETGLLECDLE